MLAVNRLVLLVAAPLFLVLAVVALLAFLFAASERDAQGWVRHTYEVMEAERRLQDDVQTAETGMRGFTLSRDASFERGFRGSLAQIPGDLRAFRELTADNPAQQARADRLQKLFEARARGFDAAVRSNAQPVIRTPEAMNGLLRGREQMTAIRREVAAGLAEEQHLLDIREHDRRDTENWEIAFAVGAGALTLVILLLAAALLVRNSVSLAAAERARANEAAILKATLETVREGIAYFTADGILCAFNGGFQALLQLPQDLVRLQQTRLTDFDALGHAALAPIFSPPGAEIGAVGSTHITWAERELDIYKAPVSTGGFIIGMVDITARMRAEATLRQSQKMEAIGHLTGGVAHDFNNLLQVISANLDLAAVGETVKSDSRLKERLENAMGAVVRGSRLTGQLLAFARRQALAPKSVDLGRVIRDMSDMLRRTLGETIAVETVIAGGLWNTLVDPSQVENTVLNLAINARDAMPDGGKLTLEVANAYLDDTYAGGHNEVTSGQYVMLAVTDTGAHMTPEVMGRVFEPFFTTKPEGKGTGLGLAQAYGFVKQSGGHIKIYSEAGHGTTIKLYLPRTRRQTDALEAASGLPVQGGHEHILVVEDDNDVRAAVVDMLGEAGATALPTPKNAESALALLRKQAPDLIFTDVVMPGAISTREFTRRAQEMHPRIRILYTSGYTQNAIVHNGKLDDDALLLSKPYRKDEAGQEAAQRLCRHRAQRHCWVQHRPAPRQGAGGGGCGADPRTTIDAMVERAGVRGAGGWRTPQEALSLLQQDAGITILLTDLGLPGMVAAS